MSWQKLGAPVQDPCASQMSVLPNAHGQCGFWTCSYFTVCAWGELPTSKPHLPRTACPRGSLAALCPPCSMWGFTLAQGTAQRVRPLFCRAGAELSPLQCSAPVTPAPSTACQSILCMDAEMLQSELGQDEVLTVFVSSPCPTSFWLLKLLPCAMFLCATWWKLSPKFSCFKIWFQVVSFLNGHSLCLWLVLLNFVKHRNAREWCYVNK